MKSIKPGRGPSQMGMAIYAAVYNHHNATSKDRYSFFDIVDEDEEADPLNERYGKKLPD